MIDLPAPDTPYELIDLTAPDTPYELIDLTAPDTPYELIDLTAPDTPYELIDLTAQDVTEPPTTQYFSVEEIQFFIDNSVKSDIPDFQSHSLSVEQTVKLVSEAFHHVYGFKNRHSCILTKLLWKMEQEDASSINVKRILFPFI